MSYLCFFPFLYHNFGWISFNFYFRSFKEKVGGRRSKEGREGRKDDSQGKVAKLQEARDVVQLIERSSSMHKTLSLVHSTTEIRPDAYNPKIPE